MKYNTNAKKGEIPKILMSTTYGSLLLKQGFGGGKMEKYVKAYKNVFI